MLNTWKEAFQHSVTQKYPLTFSVSNFTNKNNCDYRFLANFYVWQVWPICYLTYSPRSNLRVGDHYKPHFADRSTEAEESVNLQVRDRAGVQIQDCQISKFCLYSASFMK